MKIVDAVVHDLKTDYNWNRAAHLTAKGARALPSGSVHYVANKVPIIGWLPRYNPRWIINDLIAGLTLGLMLIPQSLSYAKIATIPVEYGLMSSWLPAVLYTIMGTSKDLSTGPTSLIGLLTSEVVSALSPEGYSPQAIASAVAMCMGIYGLIIGFLNLGFLLEFISLPILSGFISAVAITIILNQMSSLLGEDGVGSGTATQIHDIFHQLPTSNGYACAIGFGGIVFLTILDQVGKRYGTKGKFHKIFWFLSITRAFLALVLFTGISYAVNKGFHHSSDYLFDVVKLKSSGIPKPEMPNSELISKAFPRSIAAFIGGAIEHVAIARGFGVKNNYVVDQTQELSYYGVINFFNSFFHSMGVGGAMSRTAVNSACKVRSPLSGLMTTAVVLVCIFKLSSALYWIPKACLAAIIITAVWPLISSPVVFYKYWKTSLADFISAMIAFWLCLFVSTEVGIGAAVGFNIVYVLLRQVFKSFSQVGGSDPPGSELARSLDAARGMHGVHLPPDVRIFRFNESFFFPNAHRIKASIFDAVQTNHAPAYSSLHGAEADRNWSVEGELRIKALRKKAQITDPSTLPPINVVVLDFSRCNHIDVTAVTKLQEFMHEMKKYGGGHVEVRFAGVTDFVRERFERAGWLIIGEEIAADDEAGGHVRYFANVASAVTAPRREMDEVDILAEKQTEKIQVERVEEV